MFQESKEVSVILIQNVEVMNSWSWEIVHNGRGSFE